MTMDREPQITFPEGEINNLEEEFPIGRVFNAKETRGNTETWTIEGYEARPGGSIIRVRKKQTSRFTYKKFGIGGSREQRVQENIEEISAEKLRKAIKDKEILLQRK